MLTSVNNCDKRALIEKDFKKVLKQLSLIFKDLKAPPKKERPQTWQRFRTYNRIKQESCLRNAKIYLDICQETLSEPAAISDDSKLVWYAIRRLGLIPPPDLFEKLNDSYVIEIYNPFGIQVFRNYRFFEISSYNFAELFIYPWHELYSRNQVVDAQIAGYASQIFSGEATSTINVSDIPYHEIKELFSPDAYTMRMQEKFFAPLKSKFTNETYGAAISNVQVVNKKAEPILKRTL